MRSQIAGSCLCSPRRTWPSRCPCRRSIRTEGTVCRRCAPFLTSWSNTSVTRHGVSTLQRKKYLHNLTSAQGVRRDKAALSSGCKSHPATLQPEAAGAAMETVHFRLDTGCGSISFEGEWRHGMNAQWTKPQATENDLKQLMADVSRAMEKAQEAITRLASNPAV